MYTVSHMMVFSWRWVSKLAAEAVDVVLGNPGVGGEVADDVVRFVPDVDHDVGHLLQNLRLVTRVLSQMTYCWYQPYYYKLNIVYSIYSS